MAQASSYEITEPENRGKIETFGMEVELTTFKSNVNEFTDESQQDQEISKPEVRNLGIICAGNDSNNWDKIVYIKHYLNEKPQASDSHRTIGVGSASKELLLPDSLAPNEAIKLQFIVIGEYVFDRMVKAFVNHASSTTEIIGVMVFWGPNKPSSLDAALAWKKRIQEALGTDLRDRLPFLLITDNISSVKWIGDIGNIMESVEAMDAFCQENGFLKWFEILNSDWRLGERNEIGSAVDWLLKEALDSNEKK